MGGNRDRLLRPAALLLCAAVVAWMQLVTCTGAGEGPSAVPKAFAAHPTAAAKNGTDTHPIPRYQRGAHPNWLTPRHARKRGLVYLGTTDRLRMAMHKLQQGGRAKVTAIGGSNTVGHGAGDGLNWPQYLKNWLNDAFPTQAELHNGAIPGAMSNYMAVCTSQHVSNDSDIVIVEYAHNDIHASQATMDTAERRAYERLLRKLLKLPNRPAVILLHTYSYREVQQGPGGENFWGNAERDFTEFERYYDLPALSIKSCCFHLMLQNVTGFRVDATASEQSSDKDLKYKVFYGDNVHGGGHTGYRVMAELIISLMMVTMQGLHSSPVTTEEQAGVAIALPPPMIPGNWEPSGEKCLVGDNLRAAALAHAGWEWLDETKRDKWGFVSTIPGSELKFKLDTTTPGGAPDALVRVELAILHSYEHMGQALVKCETGCTCKESVAEGHHPERRVSQMNVHTFEVSKSTDCVVSVTVLQSTLSGEHKVKVQGLFLSDDDAARQMATRGVIDTVVEGLG